MLVPNLCSVKYRVTTDSPQCQAYFNQGLGYFYSYVWMEAARSFETAAKYDPNCAMAWWGLSRSLERWGKSKQTDALKKANELKDRASFREQQLILARLQEKGMVPGVGGADARKLAAIKTLDTLLAIHDDDEEGWYARAQLAGGAGLFGGQVSSVPFYKALAAGQSAASWRQPRTAALLRIVPPPRPGLALRREIHRIVTRHSSPLPHAGPSGDAPGPVGQNRRPVRSRVKLEQEYHRVQGVSPKDDQQFNHHLEILTVSLIHDGRFKEARAARADAEKYNYQHWLPWFRLAVASRDWPAAMKVIEHYRKTDKLTAAYMAAIVYLKQNLPARAAAEVEVLRQAYQDKKQDRLLEDRLNETQGMLLCQTGAADAGLKLLAKAVETHQERLRPSLLGQRRVPHGNLGSGRTTSRQVRTSRRSVSGGAGPRPGERLCCLGAASLVRGPGPYPGGKSLCRSRSTFLEPGGRELPGNRVGRHPRRQHGDPAHAVPGAHGGQ